MSSTYIDELDLDVSQVKVSATTAGLMVISGWTVGIPKVDAIALRGFIGKVYP